MEVRQASFNVQWNKHPNNKHANMTGMQEFVVTVNECHQKLYTDSIDSHINVTRYMYITFLCR